MANIKNGYHTGDLGYYDKEGYFFVNGRKDNLLKVCGHRINPQEIECALMATELVIETAVIGVLDVLLGNKLIAQRYLVRSLPKNTNGIIDRTKCLEIAGC